MPQEYKNNILGILLMLIDTLAIASLYTVTKFVTKDISSNYAVFFYKFFLLIIILPWVFKNGGFSNIKTAYFKVHLLRGLFSVGGSLSFMYGLQYVPLLDATVLQNVEQIILVIVGILYFHEKSTRTKITAIIISIIGVLIVVKPDIIYLKTFKIFTSDINKGYMFIFLAALFWVGNNIVIKKLGQNSSNKVQLFYLMLFSTIFAYPVAFFKWHITEFMDIKILFPKEMISFSEIGLKFEYLKLILLMAFCYLIHSISLFNALRFGEFSVVMPFVYFKLLWAGILGYLVFTTVPQFASIIGYLLIGVAGILLMRREIRNRRRIKIIAAPPS